MDMVGGFKPSEKYEFVNWDDEIPNIWKSKIHIPNHQPDCFGFKEMARSDNKKGMDLVPVSVPDLGINSLVFSTKIAENPVTSHIDTAQGLVDFHRTFRFNEKIDVTPFLTLKITILQ